MNPSVISVSEFVGIINETLNFAYPQVIIEGEVSSFKVNQGKFIFFDLKDEQNVLNCFMMVHQLKLPIEDGMKVRVTGGPKITKYSKFSFTVRAIELAGEGELRRAMELLKRKLTAEGLFEPGRKRTLPQFPRRIGLITSGTSAAYSDFIKILQARWGGVTVLLADVTVQGLQAPDQIVAALEYFNTAPEPVDVVALIRGGGSLEDLAAFSMEPVARAVAASRIPIIVGVGHEIDVSLADYAADVRAATPTDAARLIVPDRFEIEAHVEYHRRRILASVDRSLVGRRGAVERQGVLLERYLRLPQEQVRQLSSRLGRGFERLVAVQQQSRQQVKALDHRLVIANSNLLLTGRTRFENLLRVLNGFDPQATLSRGYAIVRHENRVIKEPTAAPLGADLVIQLASGIINVKVEESHDKTSI